MKEIKFRGWSLTEDKWSYGHYWVRHKNHFVDGLIVDPKTVGQFTGLCYEGDYVVMDCWNGGDGIDEPNHHNIFEGVVIYDKKICRFGLQTELCEEGQIEVGLEESPYTTIEVIGNVHQPEEQNNG